VGGSHNSKQNVRMFMTCLITVHAKWTGGGLKCGPKCHVMCWKRATILNIIIILGTYFFKSILGGNSMEMVLIFFKCVCLEIVPVLN
jgi:hypothetical protein